jgi:hypothetical protein
MSPNGTTAQLTDDQISAVFQTTRRNDATAFIPSGGTGFPHLASPKLLGDFNSNGAVDAADYVIWRRTLGSSTVLDGDGNGNRVVDPDDYAVWRSRFGDSTSDSLRGAQAGGLEGIPEPVTLTSLAAALACLAFIHISPTKLREPGRQLTIHFSKIYGDK